jgi:chromate transporter
MVSVSFKTALAFWFKLGCISFGGPAGQIALMRQELVEHKRWIAPERFLHALKFCMLLPGPEAQQLATYLGWLMHRWQGGLAAGLLFILPSFFLMIALAVVYVRFGQTNTLQAVLFGVQCAVIALIIQAMLRFAKSLLHSWHSHAIAVAAFVAVYFYRLGFPWIVIAALGLGFVLRKHIKSPKPEMSHQLTDAKDLQSSQLARSTVLTPSSQAAQSAVDKQSVVDKHPPGYWLDSASALPTHARFSWSKFILVLLLGMVLWVLPYFALVYSFGAEHRLSLMAIFFTKAALLTFGGAYAVLPYVHEGAVSQFGWISSKDMMAGLALGESTPGPLVMVLVFVGYLAGYALQLDAQTGVLAACLTAWFSFLPSFVFIFAGAPLIESTRELPSLSVPLSFLGAAMLGVMLSLALQLASKVLILKDLNTPNWPALLVFGLALWALVKLKISIPRVLASCALLGWWIQRA